jgi:hypothetical protein
MLFRASGWIRMPQREDITFALYPHANVPAEVRPQGIKDCVEISCRISPELGDVWWMEASAETFPTPPLHPESGVSALVAFRLGSSAGFSRSTVFLVSDPLRNFQTFLGFVLGHFPHQHIASYLGLLVRD